MFAYCDANCGYDSGDFNSMEEIKGKLQADGGNIGSCPKCKQDSLRID